MEVDQELIAEFVVESQEGLAHVENKMLAIEAAGADIDADVVNAVFRTMHSIKGAAGFLGLDRIGVLAHGLEELLDDMRNREIVPTSELVTTMLRSADFMKGLIDEIETSNDVDVACYVDELHRCRNSAVATKEACESLTVEGENSSKKLCPAISCDEGPVLSEAVREFLIECYENLDQMDCDLVTLEKDPTAEGLLRSIFRCMHTIKGGAGFLALGNLEQVAHSAEEVLGGLRSGELAFTPTIATALLAAVDKCREGLRLVESTGSDQGCDPTQVIEQLKSQSAINPVDSSSPVETLADSVACKEVEAPTAVVAVPIPSSHPPVAVTPANSDQVQNDKQANTAGDSTIRVDVALLDKLMTRVGELVLARNQILQYTNRRDDAVFTSTAQRLNLITTELQEGVMKTRMQPIGNVWAKFPRVVRDLASQLGKQVRIEMEGKETELDKTIVEAIKDPLTHLIRNSVDHGVEMPEVRVGKGKPAEGRLFLRAYHEGGQVNIEITDDGAGLNLERIRVKAVERGLITADYAARMSDREAAQTIMLPGFSTAEQVTSVSGRGVGMDVVKTNIERIGGTIDLQSNAGHGTTVRIKIPLTLAIIPALVVTCGGDRYAIPQVNLLELMRLDGEQALTAIEYVHGAPVFRLRGKLLPLVYLSERLNLPESDNSQCDGTVNIVVLRANDRQFGLVVDKINDTEEIVVKPLSQQLKGLSEYAGATIMGDGTVALILDVMGLALASGLIDALRDQGVANLLNDESKLAEASETLLVIDVGDSRRFALPISMISRLENVEQSAIEYADGHEVIQYRGAILPLVRLGRVFGGGQSMVIESDMLKIVVYADDQSRCGFVVNRIIDIVDTNLNLEQQDTQANLLGTAVIQQRVTDVLNLRRLACSDRSLQANFTVSV